MKSKHGEKKPHLTLFEATEDSGQQIILCIEIKVPITDLTSALNLKSFPFLLYELNMNFREPAA